MKVVAVLYQRQKIQNAYTTIYRIYLEKLSLAVVQTIFKAIFIGFPKILMHSAVFWSCCAYLLMSVLCQYQSISITTDITRKEPCKIIQHLGHTY